MNNYEQLNMAIYHLEQTMFEPIETVTNLKISYPDFADLLPIVIICVISILSITLWSLIIWKYTQKHSR